MTGMLIGFGCAAAGGFAAGLWAGFRIWRVTYLSPVIRNVRGFHGP